MALPQFSQPALSSRELWNLDLIRRHDLSGPRYTSYPTAAQFRDDVEESAWRSAMAQSNARGKPLSLYVHIPFCSTICYYCACNKIVTANRARASAYLDYLYREIELQAALVDTDRPVHQLHWGGGTPTFISDAEMRQLMAVLRRHFTLVDDECGEYSIELHPGELPPDRLWLLRELGFNRLSMGIQDFDPRVQQAVNRFNSLEQVQELVDVARRAQFRSLSMDLIYGLPHQSARSFQQTLDAVIALRPERLSVFNYAHMPNLFKTQRQIDAENLPAPEEKLAILEQSIEQLLHAGYVYIGMDHFALPEDALARAAAAGELHRNFQGYATHGNCDLLGFGISAINAIGDSHFQNHKSLAPYVADLERKALPLAKWVSLSREDHLRRAVINALICHFAVDFATLESEYSVDFQRHFSAELQALAPLEKDGLLSVDDRGIQVLPAGRLLIRRICMVFDAYQQQGREEAAAPRFSRII
tara:strand:- start:953 stop:2377 length:1425 start_codon:yes stop_codon:yes gene_type:complete